MARKPWSGKTLTEGQIKQWLESQHCSFIKEHHRGSALWRHITGHHFSVSYAECDVSMLEIIEEKIEEWVNEANKK